MKAKKAVQFIIIFLTATILTTFGILWESRQTVAQTDTNPPPEPESISFEMIGISRGQTARVNVFNANPFDYEPHPCRVNIRFIGADGRILHEYYGQPLRRTATLPNAQSTGLDVDSDTVPRDIRQRLQLRAVVTIEPADDSTVTPPCFPSVEVFNNANGRTQFMVPARTAANPEG